MAIALLGAAGANAVTDAAQSSLTLPAAALAPFSAVTGYDSAYSGESAFVTINPGETQSFQVFFTNTGTVTWTKGSETQVDLAACLEDKVTCNAQDPSEATWASGWISLGRYATTTQATVPPGTLATFSYNIKAPTNAIGTHHFNGDLVVAQTGQRIHPEGYYQDATVNAVGSVTLPTPTPGSTPFPSRPPGTVENELPHLTLPSDITALAPVGENTAEVTFNVTATGNGGIKSTVCVPASGSAFAYGTTTVSCTATDMSGNTASGTFKVTVNFAISGRVTSSVGGGGIAGVTVALFGERGAPDLRLSVATANDGSYSIVAQPGSYAVFFNPAFSAPYSRQWWNHQPESPDTVVVSGSVGGIDATLSPGIFVHGRVTDEGTGQGLPRVFVAAIDASVSCCRTISGRGTDDQGNYQFVVPAGSSIKVQFTIDPARRYMNEWWDDKQNFETATPFTVNAETFHSDAALTPAVLVTGTVTDDQTHAALAGIGVSVTDSTTACCPFGNIAFASTGTDGGYSVLVPKDKLIKISFFPFDSADPHYIREWFDDRPTWDAATIRSFTTDTSGINAALTRGLFISGHVTRGDGTPIEGLFANANDGLAGCCHFITGSRTNASGDYRILVRPGTYKVLFFSRPGFLAADGVTYVDQWWEGAPAFEQGTTVVVTTTDVGGINAVMARAVIVSGHVSDATGLAPVVGFQVNALDASGPCCRFVGGAQTDANGDYSIAVPPGLTVKVDFGVFSGPPPGTHYLPQWWKNQTSFELADSIPATVDVPNIDARLATGLLITGRVTERGSGSALPDVHVQVIDPAVPCCRVIAHTQTSATGDYALVVAAGSYKMHFFEFPLPAMHSHIGQWWQNKLFDQSADLLVVAADRGGIDAALPLAVFISGTVTDATGAIPVVGLNVSAQDASQPCCHFVGGAQTDASGNYRFAVPAGSSVRVEFGIFSGPPPGTRYIAQWWDNKPDFGVATTINALTDVSAINARLASGFVLSGHVSDASGTTALAGIGVNVNDATLPCCQFIVGTQTDAAGNYRLIVRAGQRIRVFFSTNPAGGVRYLPQWYNGKPFFDQADDIDMTQDRPEVNAALASGVLIHGRVTDSTGTIPVVGLNVSARDASQSCCQFVGGSQTDLDGQYTMVVPSGHDVKVEFGVFNSLPGNHYLGQWFRNKPDFGSADPVPTASDQNNIDARLANGFVISGHVSERGTGAALGGIQVEVVDANVPCCPFRHIAGTQTNAAGDYAVVAAAGTYKVQFAEYPLPAHPHMTQWWDSKPFDQGADLLVVAGDHPGIDAVLMPAVFIRGRVTDGSGMVGIAQVNVSSPNATVGCCQFVNGSQTDANGNYSYILPVGSLVKVQFGPPPGSPYVGQWWQNKRDFGSADQLTMSSDQNDINAALATGFVISGRVTDASSTLSLEGINVVASDATTGCCVDVAGTRTGPTGEYQLHLPAGTYRVWFGDPTNAHMPQFWRNHTGGPDQADPVTVGPDRPGISAALVSAVAIRGRVTDATTNSGVAGLFVSAQDATQSCCHFLGGGQTDGQGYYTLFVPRGSSAKVEFGVFSGPPPGTHYLGQWWNNAPSFDTATAISTATDRNNIDANLDQGFVISGQVRAPGGVGVPNTFVGASRGGAAQCCTGVGGANTDATGHYRLVLRAGIYRINVNFPPERHLVGQWWAGVPGGAADFQRATDVVLGPADAPGRDFDLQAGSVIQGHVSDAVTGAPVTGFGVTANDAVIQCCEGLAFAGTDAMGNYAFVVPAGRPVRVFFGGGPASPYTAQWWNNKPDFGIADVVDTTVDQPAIDARLASGFVISGHVTERGGGALAGVHVSVVDAAVGCCPFREVGNAQTNATGDYSVRVPAGTYKVEFSELPSPARPHMDQWWPDKTTNQDATPIVVTGDRPGIDAALDRAVFIRGHVSDATTTTPIPGTLVAAWDATRPCCTNFTADITDSSGNYGVIAPLGGQVKVGFDPPGGSRYLRQFWNNQPSFESATTINPTTDQDHIDAQLQQGFVISGTVTGPSGPASAISVSASRGGGATCCEGVGGTATDAAGHYQLTLPAGTYRINLSAPPSFRVVTQWWNGISGGTAYFDRATDIVVGPSDAPGKDFTVVAGVLIEGRVTAAVGGAPLSAVGINANEGTGVCCEGLAFAGTDSTGNYALVVPRGTQVKVLFSPAPSSPYQAQWWNGRPDFGAADMIDASSDRFGINAQLPARVAATFTLSGRVTERETGTPLAGVHVQPLDASVACCPNPAVGSGTETDALGNYSLALPGGRYKLDFFQFPFGDHPHYLQWWHDKRFDYEADVIVLTADTARIDQTLPIAAVISGQVTDADGHGIAGLQVSAQEAAGACCRFVDAAQTDALGNYRFIAPIGWTIKVEFGVFGGSPPGTHYLGEWWDDKPTFETATPVLVDGQKTLNAQLASNVGNSISGRVTDSANPGVGVANVGVMAQPTVGCCFHNTTTGADGRYSLDVTPGTYRVTFFSPVGSDYLEQWWNNKPGYSAADLLTVPSTTVDLSSINAVLVHGIPVRGTVTAAVGGAAVGQVGVVATLDDPAIVCCINYQAQTAADGTYTLYVRLGRYRINFQPPNTTDYVSEYWNGQPDFATAALLDVAGPTTNIDATLDRGFRVSGRVTDAVGDGAVQNAVITIGPAVCCGANGFAVTGPDGTYSVTVREGSYKVGFNPPYGSDFVLQYWNNKPNFGAGDILLVNESKPNINAVLRHGFPVTGRISDAADASVPLPGASVNALTAGDFQFVAYASAGADGSYSLFLPAGDYILWFSGPYGSDYGFEYWNDKADQASADVVHVAGPTTNMNVGLARFVRISGRVTDEAGQPIAGLFVNVDKSTTAFQFVAGASTDGDGRYSVLVPTGSYKVLFPSNGLPFLDEWWNDKPSFAAADPIDVTSSVTGINAVLARGVVISGHIKSATGATLAGTAFLSDGNTACCTFSLGHGTTSDGAYSFTVPAGNYFVGFYAAGYKFQYWNGKSDPLMADVLPAAANRSGIDAALAPIDASAPAGAGSRTDGSSPGGSPPPIDGTVPAGSGAPTDGTPGAGALAADDRVIARMPPVWQLFEESWSSVVT